MAIGKIQSAEEIGRYYMHGVSHHLGAGHARSRRSRGSGSARGHGHQRRAGAVYRRGEIGIRIEDDLLITDTGCRVLSEAIPRTTEEIEALMAR